jgi:hypothetical protein
MSMTASAGTPVIGRRRFLGAVAAVVGVGVGVAGVGVVKTGMVGTVAAPGRGLFSALPFIGDAAPFTRTEVLVRLGETFRIIDGVHAGTRLVLTSVVELPNGGQAIVPDDQFAARFVAGPTVELDAGTYLFATSSFGELPLFISALVNNDGTTVGYEALVNRHVPPGAVWALALSGGWS